VRSDPDRTALAVIALGVVGIAVSAYLTIAHYTGAALACQASSLIDCEAVTTSSYSLVPGTTVPVSVPGLLWAIVVIGLGVALARGAGRRVDLALVAWSALAMVPVLYLVRAEIAVIYRICLWCTVFHLVVLAVLLLALARLQAVPDDV
jgi:uncharacterized membrane protein